MKKEVIKMQNKILKLLSEEENLEKRKYYNLLLGDTLKLLEMLEGE